MNQKKFFQGSSLIGLILVVLGALWILNNLDMMDFRLSEWWPLILIIIGLIHLVGSRRLFNGGAWILISLGVIFLLTTNDILEWSEIWKYWPAILIIIGISFITRHRVKPVPATTGEDEIQSSVVFGDIDKNIKSEKFKGGSISTIFGDTDIDLTKSNLDENGAVVNVSTVFGDTDIRVPETWPLDVQSSAFLGELKNKASNEIKKSGKRLIIKSSTIFGDLKIKN